MYLNKVSAFWWSWVSNKQLSQDHIHQASFKVTELIHSEQEFEDSIVFGAGQSKVVLKCIIVGIINRDEGKT